jgi:hypothetical protein
MTLSDRYDGSADAFEGDRTIVRRSLPSNATVTKAAVKVTPAAAPGGILFEEVISLTNGTGDLGSTKNLRNAAGLSQVVPVAGPCSYEFSFWGLSDDADAVAEIFWLDQKASLLRTDTLPFEVVTGTVKRNALVETSRKVQLQRQRASLTSPPGASQAEVRFTVPAFATVILGKTSLKGTAEILSDSGFRLLQNGVPAGWTLIPQAAPGISLSSSGGAISLLNSSTVDAELMQTIAIGENKQFDRQFQGRAVPVGTAQPGAQAELRFLQAGGAAAGPSMELKIVSDAFAKFPATGTTPAGTAQVQIHLKAPSGTGLEIDEVSLQTPPTAPVPLTFVAQSPGELRVPKSLVTYDVVPVAPPPVPSTGIATPTAPARKPGDPPCDVNGPCCQAEQPITQPSSKMTAAGRPMIVGSCSTCGSPRMRPGGPLLNGAPVLHFPVLASHRLVPWPSCSSNHASAAAAHSRPRDARRPCASISGSRHHVFRTTCGCVTRGCRQGDEGTVAEKRSRLYRKRKNAHCVVEAFCYKAPERFWLGSALMDVYLKAR